MRGHIFLAAVIRGVPFAELKLGFLGINPSVTLPRWVDQNTRTVIFYAGGLSTGAVFLLGYLLYWVRKYRREAFTTILGDGADNYHACHRAVCRGISGGALPWCLHHERHHPFLPDRCPDLRVDDSGDVLPLFPVPEEDDGDR
jgi:hypothetical protein